MRTIQILVKANYNVESDTEVSVQVDTSSLSRNNEVTLRFDNGDYCDINVEQFYDTGWYLTTYVNVYAKENFVQQLKEGEITIEELDCEDCPKKGGLS